MDCNAEEAGHAKIEGNKHLLAGNFTKAVKLFEISLRLHENPDVGQLLASAKAALITEPRNRNEEQRSRGTESDQERSSERRPPNTTWSIINNPFSKWLFSNSILERIFDIETRVIAPAAKLYVRGMIAIIYALIIWKFVLQRLSAICIYFILFILDWTNLPHNLTYCHTYHLIIYFYFC